MSKVVVVGGGLAGISASIALPETGADVTLLEARPRLGGATCSFSRNGLTVDTGQHIFLGCCTAYRGLLARLGMTGHATLQDRFGVTVQAPCIVRAPWAWIRFFPSPNGCQLPPRRWRCAAATRPTPPWTRSGSATG